MFLSLKNQNVQTKLYFEYIESLKVEFCTDLADLGGPRLSGGKVMVWNSKNVTHV